MSQLVAVLLHGQLSSPARWPPDGSPIPVDLARFKDHQEELSYYPRRFCVKGKPRASQQRMLSRTRVGPPGPPASQSQLLCHGSSTKEGSRAGRCDAETEAQAT